MIRFKALSTFRFFIALGFGLAVLWALPASAPAAFGNGLLVFESHRPDGLNGASDVFIMAADGSGQTQITDHGGSQPAWNADGTKIAFSTQHGYGDPRAWPENIFLMNPDGGGATYVIGADPSALTSKCGFNRQPTWSPDGTKIAVQMTACYVNGQVVQGGIFVVDVATHAVTRLTTNRPGFADDVHQAWSHDGTKIAFASADEGGRYQINVMDTEGRNVTKLTSVTANNTFPTWSPDDSQLVFASIRDGNTELFVMDADGSNQVQLTETTNHPAIFNTYPNWSPDGSKIAFASNRDTGGSGAYEIYVMNSDGSSPTQLTFNDSHDLHPQWQPVGGDPPPPHSGTAIEVVLDMVPDVDLDVPFNISLQGGGTLESFYLDDDADPTLPSSHVKASLANQYFVGPDLSLKALSGYELSTSCVDPDGGTTLFPSGIAKVDLDQDETVSCTFTLTEDTAPPPAGTIEIRLDAVPDDPQDFGFRVIDQPPVPPPGAGVLFFPFSLDDDSDASLASSVTFPSVYAGDYVIRQDALPAGWDLSAITCDDPDGGSNVDVDNATATLDVDDDETVSCTFTTAKLPPPPPSPTGTIDIKVDAFPNDPQDFGFRVIDQPPVPPPGAGVLFFPFSLDDDSDAALPSSMSLPDVYAGSYTIRQDAMPAGWDLTGITCADPDGGSNTDVTDREAIIDLDDDETVTCTFTVRAQRGTITIVKDALPDARRDFSFTSSLGDFELDDDDTFKSPSPLPGQRSFGNLSRGTYTVRERAPGGNFYLTGLICNDPDGGTSVDLANRRVNIDIDWGERITCTFTNSQTTLVVVMDAIPDAPKDFSFQGSGDVPDFDLDDDSTLRNPSALSDQRSFDGIAPALYLIREQSPGGVWTLTGIVCDDPDGGTTVSLGNRRANIDLDPGETVTCTFTNGQSRLIVVNDTVPDAKQDFSFLGSGAVPDFDLDDDDTFKNPSPLPRQRMFPDLTPGTYPIRERPSGGGFYLTSIVCNDPDGGTNVSLGDRRANVDLDPGETITCTFTNAASGP